MSDLTEEERSALGPRINDLEGGGWRCSPGSHDGVSCVWIYDYNDFEEGWCAAMGLSPAEARKFASTLNDAADLAEIDPSPR